MQSSATSAGRKRLRSPTKRTLSDSTAGGTDFNECMRCFKGLVEQLQQQQRDAEAQPPAAPAAAVFELSAWTLLSQLRPFLFLCFPTKLAEEGAAPCDAATVAEVAAAALGNDVSDPTNAAARHCRTGDSARDTRHALIAQRVYKIVVAIAARNPAALLHGCLTLLYLLPRLADPNPACEKDTAVFLGPLASLLLSLRLKDPPSFFSLVTALTCSDGFGALLAPPTEPGLTGTAFPSRTIRVLPEGPLLEHLAHILGETSAGSGDDVAQLAGEDVKKLFRCSMSPRTTYESLTTAFGLWSLLAALGTELHAVLTPAGVDVSYLVLQACDVLSLHVENGPVSTLDGSRQPGAAPPSSPPLLRPSRPGAPPPSPDALTAALHNVVGPFLAMLADKQALNPDLHARVILSTVVDHILRAPSPRPDGPQPQAAWPFRLLQWVGSAVSFASEEGRVSPWLLSALFGDDGRLLQCMLYACCKLLSQSSDAAIGMAPPALSVQLNALSVDAATLLLSLLQQAVSTVPGTTLAMNKILLAEASGGILGDWIDCLLCVRYPTTLWLFRQSGIPPAGESPNGPSGALPAAAPSQLLALSAALLALFPVAVLHPRLEDAHQRAMQEATAPALRLVEARVATVLRAPTRFPNERSSRLPSLNGRAAAPVQQQWSFPSALMGVMECLGGEQCGPAEASLLMEAFVVLFLLPPSSISSPPEGPAASITIVDSQASKEDPLSRSNAAIAVLRCMEDYCVAHRTAYQVIPGPQWSLFYATMVENLPFADPTGEQELVPINVIRRGCLVPRKTPADMGAFASRLAGFCRGMRLRLYRFLCSFLPNHTAELKRLPLTNVGSISDGLAADLEVLLSLFQEAMLLSSSLLALLQFAGESTTPQDFTDEATLCFLLRQAALLQRVLFDAIRLASCVSTDHLLGSGGAALAANPQAAPLAPHIEEVVVDVDDTDADDDVAQAGTSLKTMDTGAASGAITTTNRHSGSLHVAQCGSSVLGNLTTVHGQILSALSQLLIKTETPSSAAAATTTSNATLLSACHRIVCTALVIAPLSRDVDRAFFAEILCSPDAVVHGGYAPVSLARMILCRQDFSALQHARQLTAAPSLLGWLPTDEPAGTDPQQLRRRTTSLVAKLTCVTTAFRSGWDDFLPGSDFAESADMAALYISSATVAVAPLVRDTVSTAPLAAEGEAIVCECVALWEDPLLPPAIKVLVTTTAVTVLGTLHWSPEDLCRRHPHVVSTDFFTDLCSHFGVDPATVIRRSEDAVIAPLVFSSCLSPPQPSIPRGSPAEDDRQYASQRLDQMVRDSMKSDNGAEAPTCFAPAMAYLLYTSSTADEKFNRVLLLMTKLKLQVADFPVRLSRALPSVVLRLISLEADAQLACLQHGDEAGCEREAEAATTARQRLSDSVCFSVFAQAIGQLVSLASCAPTHEDVAKALQLPAPQNDSRRALVDSLFNVIDRVERFMLPAKALPQEAQPMSLPVVSRTTTCRWLLGLNSYIRFLGEVATPLAAKVPTMLEACTSEPALMETICRVWHTLVSNCADHYIHEHASAMVVELVSLNFYHTGANDDQRAFQLLLATLKVLFDKTRGQKFWKPYFAVMGTTDKLIHSLSELVDGTAFLLEPSLHDSRRGGRRRSPPALPQQRHSTASLQAGLEDPRAEQQLADKVTAIMGGFLDIMNSDSANCKAVFLGSLHNYLSGADPTLRLRMGKAAAANLGVAPALLRCVRELADTQAVQWALQCIGILGAVAPIPVDTLPNDDTVARTQRPLHLSETSACQPSYLTVPLLLEWRELARQLLAKHCPRALANTADPHMHGHAAYAVQELLRIYTKKERSEANTNLLRDEEMVHTDELARYVWWNGLDENTQKSLSFFTTTRYATLVWDQAEARTPVYAAGMTCDTWLFAFFNRLSPRCVGTLADTAKALRNVAKRDPQLLIFLLHLMVAQLLDKENEEDDVVILTEFRTVFSTAACAVPGSVETLARRSTGGESGQHPRMSLRSDSAMEMRPGADALRVTNARSVDEHVQCLLHLLEDIKQLRWALLFRGRPAASKAGSNQVSRADCAADIRLSECYQKFLNALQWSISAQAAIDVHSHIRALRCIESEPTLPKVTDATAALPLQRIFAALNDRASAKCIHDLSRGLDPADAAFSLENTGEWQLAMQHCELVLQHHRDSITHQLTYLRCMRQLGQHHMMSCYAEHLLDERRVRGGEHGAAGPTGRRFSHDLLSQSEDWSAGILRNYANEAAWRLGEWDRVSTDPTLPVSLAVPVASLMSQLMLDQPSRGGAVTSRDRRASLVDVCAATALERVKLAPLLRSAGREGYSQAYLHVVMLHAFSDVEQVSELYHRAAAELPASGTASLRSPGFTAAAVHLPDQRQRTLRNIVALLKARLELVDNTLEAREPLLSLHRSIYRALGLAEEVSDTWICNARLLKDGNFPDAALSAARQSNYYASAVANNSSTGYHLLTTELLQGMNNPARAVEFAQSHIDDERLTVPVRAQLRICVANMAKDMGAQTHPEVILSYQRAIAMDPASEVAHHSLALFYDHLFTMGKQQIGMKKLMNRDAVNVNQQMLLQETVDALETYALKAVEHFGTALLNGVETVSISLPRLLTLWLDSTEELSKMRLANQISPHHKSLGNFNHVIDCLFFGTGAGQCVPPRVVMNQLTLLLSRLGHSNTTVVDRLTRLVGTLMIAFPQQTLWNVLSISHSSKRERSDTARSKILEPYCQTSKRAEATVVMANSLFNALIGLCMCTKSELEKNNCLLTKMPFLQTMLRKPTDRTLLLLVPTVRNMTPCISADNDADVFVNSPTLQGFRDRVHVLKSKQAPKRFFVKTNEGMDVSYLAKTKDEPRKDIRTMEVALLMNTIFLKSPDGRRKRFSLLRYCIAALNDDCAIIEWVDDISSLRDCVNEGYRLANTGAGIEALIKWDKLRQSKDLTPRQMLREKILPITPPVLHRWFDRSFTMNQEWYQARTLCTQSTALWSMVGHIVGLGDRHAENLNIGLNTGEMVHVDFGYVFDEGETLPFPERVRFRLTQNVVDGMGVLGANGPFKANCEVALRCQHDNRKAIMSIVETLVHDPLLGWRKSASNVTPQQRMDRVSRRLDGYLGLFQQPPDTLALSIEGQVAKLISHASALENLEEMYTWWMPWV